MGRRNLRKGCWNAGASGAGLVIFLCASSLDFSGSTRSLAEMSSPQPRTGFQSGQVTGKRGSSIQINQREYLLDKEVTVKDDEDRPRELKDINEGAEVLFHLKRDRIDQLVLILPK